MRSYRPCPVLLLFVNSGERSLMYSSMLTFFRLMFRSQGCARPPRITFCANNCRFTSNGSASHGEPPLAPAVNRCSGSFRAMRPGNCGNLGNVGNVESVTCRPHYPGDGTNPPLSASITSFGYSRRSIPACNRDFQGPRLIAKLPEPPR